MNMLAFLAENLATMIVGLVLAAVVVLIIVKLRKDKKSGKSNCAGGCTHCASAGMCHHQPPADHK